MKRVTQAFTFCHADTFTYTGIDTLINITGYYANPENNLRHLIFYNNGLVVSRINDFNHERWKNDKPKNIPLFLEEVANNPDTKDALYYCNFVDCGRYMVSGDTIKAQIIHNYHSLNDNWNGYERWYKIIDKNTLLSIKTFYLTTDKREKAFIEQSYRLNVGDYSIFIPADATPPPNYYWILKEKWFWCDECDWKHYKDSLRMEKRNRNK